MNISKELLSEVLNVNVQTELQEDDFCSDNTLIYWEFDDYHNDYKNINIYELAHKCKEWAIKQHKIDLITLELDKNEKTISCSILYGEIHPNMKMYYFNADTEIEAIFKACQWILDNKKEGN